MSGPFPVRLFDASSVLDIDKVEDVKGRGNSTMYLVKLRHQEERVWVKSEYMDRRDLVREYQRRKSRKRRADLRRASQSQRTIHDFFQHQQRQKPEPGQEEATGPVQQVSGSQLLLQCAAENLSQPGAANLGDSQPRLMHDPQLSPSSISDAALSLTQREDCFMESPVDGPPRSSSSQPSPGPQQIVAPSLGPCSLCQNPAIQSEFLFKSACSHASLCHSCFTNLYLLMQDHECAPCKNLIASFLWFILTN